MPGATYLTAATLITDRDDPPNGKAWREVMGWLRERGHGWAGRGDVMRRVDERYGGDGIGTQIVGGGVFNYLRLYEFADHVVSRPWVSPDSVVLICDAEGQGAYVFRPKRWLDGIKVHVRSRRQPYREHEYPTMSGALDNALSPEVVATLRAYGLEPTGLNGIQVKLDLGEIIVWVD